MALFKTLFYRFDPYLEMLEIFSHCKNYAVWKKVRG